VGGRVLVIAPHPDDEVLGCGGVIARHASLGDEVSVLIVTKGVPEIFPPDQVQLLREEVRAAHQLLRVPRVDFLDFPAPRLDTVPAQQLADAIAQVMQSISPEVVYLPHHGDLHADHRSVHHAALVATRPRNGTSIRKLVCYETLSETEWAPPVGDQVFAPNLFVDISAYLDTKLEAMRSYCSQLRDPPHPRSLRAIEALARLRGSTVGLFAAEAFMTIREIL